MFLRDIAGLKMSLYCEDPTSVSTTSAHLVSHGSCQRGACHPHPANSEKRHMLYKKFWRCLAPWEYAWEDKRDIMPDCVIEVGPSSKSK